MPLVTGVQTCALPILNDRFPRTPAISIIFVDDSRGKAKSRRSRYGKLFPARKGILGSPHIMKKFAAIAVARSEEHTSELQSLMRISYAVFCLKKKKSINLIYIM